MFFKNSIFPFSFSAYIAVSSFLTFPQLLPFPIMIFFYQIADCFTLSCEVCLHPFSTSDQADFFPTSLKPMSVNTLCPKEPCHHCSSEDDISPFTNCFFFPANAPFLFSSSVCVSSDYCYFIYFHLFLLSELSFYLFFSSSASLVAYKKQFFFHIMQPAASAQLIEDELFGNYRVIDHRPGKDLQRLFA